MKINYKFLLENVPTYKIGNFKRKINNINEKENLNIKILNECNDNLYREYENYLNEKEKESEEIEEKEKLKLKKTKSKFNYNNNIFPKLNINNNEKNNNDNNNKENKKTEFKINSNRNNNIKYKIKYDLNEKNIFHNPLENNKYSIYSNYKKPILKLLEKENKNLGTNNQTDSNLINSTTINSNQKNIKKKTLKLSLQEFIENDKINKDNLYKTNNNYFNKIKNLCNNINNECSDNFNKIKNRPKFHFVSQNEIQSNINKVALGVKPGNTDAINAFQNMRIFRETKAMTKISYDLSFNANKLIKKLLIKDKNKKKKNYINLNQIEKSKEIRSKMFNLAFDIINKSEGIRKDCINTINKRLNKELNKE